VFNAANVNFNFVVLLAIFAHWSTFRYFPLQWLLFHQNFRFTKRVCKMFKILGEEIHKAREPKLVNISIRVKVPAMHIATL